MDKEVWEKLKSTIGHLKELDLPTTGWELSDVIDLKDDDWDCDYEDCELCGHEIRYVHVMTNERFGVVYVSDACVLPIWKLLVKRLSIQSFLINTAKKSSCYVIELTS